MAWFALSCHHCGASIKTRANMCDYDRQRCISIQIKSKTDNSSSSTTGKGKKAKASSENLASFLLCFEALLSPVFGLADGPHTTTMKLSFALHLCSACHKEESHDIGCHHSQGLHLIALRHGHSPQAQWHLTHCDSQSRKVLLRHGTLGGIAGHGPLEF